MTKIATIISFVVFVLWTFFTAVCIFCNGFGYVGSFGDFHLDSIVFCAMSAISLGLLTTTFFLCKEDR